MRQLRLRKVSLNLLVLLLVLVVAAGCSGNNKQHTETASPSAGTSGQGAEAGLSPDGDAQGEPDPFGKYDPPIEVSFVRTTDDSIEQNVLKNLPDETLEDNRWLKLYAEELGIQIKYDWITKGTDQFVQKMNIAISSGELPDFVQVDAVQMKQLVEAGMLQDITELYDQYASDTTKSVISSQGTAPMDAATIDGKLWGIPLIKPSYDSIDYLWVRTDWLEKLNLPEPESMNDVLNIIEAFATQDPDGNNVDDTVGLVVHKDLFGIYGSLTGFFNGYHAYPNTWYDDGYGNLVFGSIQQEMKAPLMQLQELYKKGYMDVEFGVKDFFKVGETTIGGKSGIHYGAPFNSLWPLQPLRNNDPSAEWRAYTIVSTDGKLANVTYKMGTDTWLVVNKDAKHPEAMIKLLNMFVEKVWSDNAEYDYYFYPPEAEGTWKLSPVYVLPDVDIYTDLKEAERTGDGSKLTGAAKNTWELMEQYKAGNDALWGIWRGNGGGESSTSAQLEKYINEDRLLINQFVGAPSDTYSEKWSALNNMQNEILTKIIVGNAGIEEFDKFINDWLSLGGEQITKEVNEWYSSLK